MTNDFTPPKPARLNLLDVLLIAIPLTVVLVYVVSGPVMQDWNKRRERVAQSKGLLLGLAAIQYEQGHGGRLPPADHWESRAKARVASRFPHVHERVSASPRAVLGDAAPVRVQPRVGRKNLNLVNRPEDVVLFYKSSLPGPNAADNLAMPAPADTGCIVIVHGGDGWAEWVSEDRVAAVFQASHQQEALLQR